jgi:tripartite ATP-independent transporter DctM subunit
MSPLIVGLVGFIIMLILKGLRSPIGLGLGLVGFCGVWFLKGFDTAIFVLGTAPIEKLSNFTLSVLPLFILMGAFAVRAGLADGLYNAANAFIGHFRGGLAMASIVACGGFGAVNGSSLVTAATMAKIAVPQMIRFGYDPRLAAGAVATGGTLGILIPPSLAMIIYAVLTETSIGKLFAAGIVPGIIAILLYVVTIAVWTKRRPGDGPAQPCVGWGQRFRTLREVWGVALLFGSVMGGIFFGIFSPTEGGAVGAAGALLIGVFTGRMGLVGFISSLRDAVMTTAMILFIVIGISIFEFFLTSAQFPQELAKFIGELGYPDPVIFAGIVALLLFLGMFMEVIAIIFIVTPFIFPIIVDMGYDPVWFGIIMVMVAEFGVVTPPVGMNVFVVAKMVPEVTLTGVFQGVAPFLIADVVRLGLIMAFPILALWLPNLLFQ